MRLISKQPNYEFKVFKKSRVIDGKETREVNPGEVFTVDSQDSNAVAEANALVHRGYIEPLLIPNKGEFKAVCSFTLRDNEGKLTDIKNGEIIELSQELILPLILGRKVIPIDLNECWCPFRLKEKIEIKKPWEEPSLKKDNWITSWKAKHPVAGLKKNNKTE